MKLKLRKCIQNKVFQNAVWMIGDKAYMLVLQFFIGVKIANLYGATLYGTFALASSYMTFSTILTEILNTRILKIYYGKNSKTVSTSMWFYFFCSIVTILISAVVCLQERSLFSEILLLIAISNLFGNVGIAITNYYEYLLKSSVVLIIKNTIGTTSYLIQLYLLWQGFSIFYILGIKLSESLIKIVILLLIFQKEKKGKNTGLDIKLLMAMIRESFFLWITYISYIIYTQLDRVMIGNILGVEEVGVYSIAVGLSNTSMIILSPIMNSIFPKMLSDFRINYNEYLRKYKMLTFSMTQLYFFGGITSCFVLQFIFPYFFNEEYYEAVYIYGILMIGVLFRANAAFQTSHITIKNNTKLNFMKTIIGLGINIVLNTCLIPKYGIYGAAMATSFTSFVTLFVIDFFIPSYREHAWIQLRAFYRWK